MGRPRLPLRYAKNKYNYNKIRQEKNGNVWDLSFEDWYAFFLANGIDKNLTNGPITKNFLCLVRKDESKPFNKNNISLATQGANNIGRPCRSLGKSRPNTWIIKDPALHKMYIPFLKAKAQTAYRVREGLAEGIWLLSFEDFVDAWGDLWQFRGKSSLDYAMTREDFEKDWTRDNVIIVTRKEQLQRAHDYRESRDMYRGRK